MDDNLDNTADNKNPLPPPATSAPVFAPSVPPTESNPRPAVATSHQPGTQATATATRVQAQQLTTARYVGDQFAQPKRQRSRSTTYGIIAVLFLLISAAGYVGFREYIYGDDAPPVIDFDRDE